MALATIGKLKKFLRCLLALLSLFLPTMNIMKNLISYSFAIAFGVSTQAHADFQTEADDALKTGKVMCMTPLPELGCESYTKVNVKDGTVFQSADIIFTVQPTAVAFVEYEPMPETEFKSSSMCSRISGSFDKKVSFRAVGRNLSELELGMFKSVYEERTSKVRGKRICVEPIETEKGPAFKLVADGVDIDAPPLFISWHFPKDLPPLIGGATTILKFDE